MILCEKKEQIARLKGYFNQVLMVILMNVPTISFGLATGWVSVASGETEEGSEDRQLQVVVGAAGTYAVGFLGVPLAARAIASGRKPAVIATSVCFLLCWGLKLAGDGWWLVAARAAAGLGSCGAWTIAPLLAKEMCSSAIGGASVAALIPAHNLGVLLMYLAADFGLPHRTVLWWSLGLSAVHCVAFLFAPESPAYLAANGKIEEARAAMAWLRGRKPSDPELIEEMATMPEPEDVKLTPLKLTKEMLSDPRRRRAFIISFIAVVGQETCGILALLLFAERVFVLARDETPSTVSREKLTSPARHAVILGAVQLVSSCISLYLVERVGRRPLIVWTAFATGLALACGAVVIGIGGVNSSTYAAIALAIAVAADSTGLHPAPYSLLADMFNYEYRSCAMMISSLGSDIGNLVEVALFPVIAAEGGVKAALGVAAGITLSYTIFAICFIPETRGYTPEQIYEKLIPNYVADEKGKDTKQSELDKDSDMKLEIMAEKVSSNAVVNCDSEIVIDK